MSIQLRTRNDGLFAAMEPFLVATAMHRDRFDQRPFGLEIPQANIIDPMRVDSERFLHLLQTLDRLTFGPEGMPMPRWVFYDCAELPGGIFGFGRRSEALPQQIRDALGLEANESCLVPFSMYVAIPVRPPGAWFGHNLASLNPVFPALAMKGLASITKALALKVFRCAEQVGATQWDSDALHIHSRFGPLDLVTAWTPAHSESATLTYRFEITDAKLRNALGDPEVSLRYPATDFEIEAGDEQAMQALQTRIEAGEQFVVTGPPRRHGRHRRVGVARRTPPASDQS